MDLLLSFGLSGKSIHGTSHRYLWYLWYLWYLKLVRLISARNDYVHFGVTRWEYSICWGIGWLDIIWYHQLSIQCYKYIHIYIHIYIYKLYDPLQKSINYSICIKMLLLLAELPQLLSDSWCWCLVSEPHIWIWKPLHLGNSTHQAVYPTSHDIPSWYSKMIQCAPWISMVLSDYHLIDICDICVRT